MCERFFGSVRRECLDHFLLLSESHLRRILKAYVAYFNQTRQRGKFQLQTILLVPDAGDGLGPLLLLEGTLNQVDSADTLVLYPYITVQSVQLHVLFAELFVELYSLTTCSYVHVSHIDHALMGIPTDLLCAQRVHLFCPEEQ